MTTTTTTARSPRAIVLAHKRDTAHLTRLAETHAAMAQAIALNVTTCALTKSHVAAEIDRHRRMALTLHAQAAEARNAAIVAELAL